MVRRCTYRAPPSGIQGGHRDDLVAEEDEDEDDVGLIVATILVIILIKRTNCSDAALALERAAL